MNNNRKRRSRKGSRSRRKNRSINRSKKQSRNRSKKRIGGSGIEAGMGA